MDGCAPLLKGEFHGSHCFQQATGCLPWPHAGFQVTDDSHWPYSVLQLSVVPLNAATTPSYVCLSVYTVPVPFFPCLLDKKLAYCLLF